MKRTLIIVTVTLLSLSASAQFRDMLNLNSGGMFSVQWNIAKPLGSMDDFVKNTSFSGVSFDYRHCYKKDIIIGGRTGWNYFYENKGLTNVEDGTSTTYKPLNHKVHVIPLMLIVDYMVKSNKFIPYAGIYVGTYFLNSAVKYNNVMTASSNTFHFGVSPEVGLTIPFIISNFGLNLSTRYNYALGAGSSSGYSWFDFNIGISFMY